jgi:uracil-DNA glycosylase
LPGLFAVPERDPDGVRRGTGAGAPDAGRRAAGRSGRPARAPFVGPAGQLLDWALEKAGIERGAAYVTNVVKHFKWVPRGRRRIHSKPSSLEIKACLPWLEAELELVRPKVLVCLGSTAAQALLGSTFRVTQERGRWLRSRLAPHVMATVHPSALLRIEDDATRKAAIREFVRELRLVADVLSSDV